MAPGSTVTSATAIVFATLNVRESATLTVPPACCVGCRPAKSNVNGSGGAPYGLCGACACACVLSEGTAGGAGVSVSACQPVRSEEEERTRENEKGEGSDARPGKMYSSWPGMRSNAASLVWKFFASTSFGTCASQSVSCARARPR